MWGMYGGFCLVGYRVEGRRNAYYVEYGFGGRLHIGRLGFSIDDGP